MAQQQDTRPIIIKRVKKSADGHHGGAWKVAYADFVTAMMAFFLLMWLLNATSEEQRRGIADYFDPTLPISRTSAGGLGMLAGESIFSEATLSGMRDRGIKRRPDRRPDNVAGGAAEGIFAGVDRPKDSPEQGQPAQSAMPETESPGATDSTNAATARDLPGVGEDLGARVASIIEGVEDETIRRHFRLRATPEGLVIEIVDLSDEPLFEAGSSRASPVLDVLLAALVPVLATTSNDIAIIGHTDAQPFASGASYTNWELSADRANTARRLLGARGLSPERLVRVSGVAATQPFGDDPAAAENRRIAILMLRQGRR